MTNFLLFESSIQLVPDGTIFLHIVLVLVMVAVLNRSLFVPVNRVLSERRSKAKDALRKAADIERRIEHEERRYKEALRAGRAASYKLTQESRNMELVNREERLATVRSEVQQQISTERKSIEQQARAARSGFDVMALGTMIRDRVLNPLENRGTAK